MRIIECATPAEVAVVAAHQLIRSVPRVLGVATRSTPVDHPRLTVVADRAAVRSVSRTDLLTPHLEYR